MSLKKKKKPCIEGFFCFFLNSKMMELALQFKKNKGYLRGCFGIFRLVLLLFLGFVRGGLVILSF
jgi:hypothetical protein